MKDSIIISKFSLKASSIAGIICSRVLTLVVPKLEPPSVGLIKQGSPTLRITSSGSTASPLRMRMDSATSILQLFKILLSMNLLKVRAEGSTSQVEKGMRISLR
ncbi:MAG: hypothetical protein BWY95_02019 [Bacteroidetes bacterium ADurb.BinA104]|nr:MAG: hypothetical protein BWY95_02019 [Bacteroidetes bacterium ADurb.BinA104]